MVKNQIGSFQLMKNMNKRLILTMIHQNQVISRAEIAKKTTLTPPTITNLVSELLEEGIVIEGEMGVSSGGRKPIMLMINESHSFVVAVDIRHKDCRFALGNLMGKILEVSIVPIPYLKSEVEFIGFLTRELQQFIYRNQIEEKKLLGIGIGIQGIVHHERGMLVYSPALQLRNVEIKKEIETYFHVPVMIENNARLMALAEKYHGNGHDSENLFCLNVGYSVGSGIIYKGEILRGQQGIAGEVGHVPVDLNGPICTCGNRGCLDSIIGHEGILQYIKQQMQQGKQTKLKDVVKKIEDITPEVLYEAARDGDELARQVFQRIGYYIGLAIHGIIHTINPDKIIIGGEISKASSMFLSIIQEVISTHALIEESQQTEILIAHHQERGALIGAISLVVQTYFLEEAAK